MSTPDAIDDLYRRPGFLLKRCHQVSVAIFIDECREFNITPSQYGALRVLSRNAGLDQIALARLTGLDRSTVGLVIKLLERRNLVTRAANPADKRRMEIRLTPEGERLLAAMIPCATRAQERVLAGLPPHLRPLFLEVLQTFLAGHGAVISSEEILASSFPAA